MDKDKTAAAPGALINPMKFKNSPDLGPLAVMAATAPDAKAMASGLRLKQYQQLPMSRASYSKKAPGLCVAGPFMGAPYAVYVLEQIIAWGVDKIIFFGWCGSISPELEAGAVILPDSSFVDEGTSVHYSDPAKGTIVRSFASQDLRARLGGFLGSQGVEFFSGPVWTTDALFRETPEKIESFAKKGALAVEMELSALQTVAAFRDVELCSLLVVSDELHSGKWKPGFANPKFQKCREKAIEVLCRFCRQA